MTKDQTMGECLLSNVGYAGRGCSRTNLPMFPMMLRLDNISLWWKTLEVPPYPNSL
jgi:hypothetical protein